MEKKTINILYWAITILFVLFICFGAVSELMQVESAQKILGDLGYPVYLNYILGVAKIIGGIVLLQWACKTIKEWAYAGFTIDIIGAAASNFFASYYHINELPMNQAIFGSLFTLAFLIPLFLSYWLWKKKEEQVKA